MLTMVSYNAGMRHSAKRWGGVWLMVMLCAAALQVGCSQNEPDVAKALQLEDVESGWFDAGIVNGQNKLVPTVSFRVKNVADRPLSYVSFNTVFKVIGDPKELSASYLKGFDTLKPGDSSQPMVARSSLGYTSPEPRLQMLQHSQFKDVEAEVFAKHGSNQWVSLGKYTVKRQLITQ
jgi:hypothetical protein